MISDYKSLGGMHAAQGRVILLLRTLRPCNQVPLQILVCASAIAVSHLALRLATSNA
jgi:hypothetical protein